jgi:hypothetical protein
MSDAAPVMKKLLIPVMAALISVGVVSPLHASALAPANRAACTTIYNEFRRQGASPAVAQRFAYTIAWRESGCVPQYVHNRTDWSYSRLGLNGLTAALRAGWMRLCHADVRSATRSLPTDVRCALAAYRVMGWAPWRATR